jgi:hypothetical protein
VLGQLAALPPALDPAEEPPVLDPVEEPPVPDPVDEELLELDESLLLELDESLLPELVDDSLLAAGVAELSALRLSVR